MIQVGVQTEGAAVIRLETGSRRFHGSRNQQYSRHLEEERVVAEEEEAVHQAQVGARRATMLSGEESS